MLVWSLFCGLMAATVGIVSLLVVRMIFGMGEGPFCASINKLVSNWYPRDRQASALGIANSGQSVGAAIAAPVVGFLALAMSWRISFVIIGAVGVLWVAAWLLFAKDKPATPVEESAATRVQDISRDERGEPASLSTYLLRPAILATAFAFFGYAYILYFFLSWFPSYLRRWRIT